MNPHHVKSRSRILQVKPWLKSTGPKTLEGKARLIHLRKQHGLYSEEFQLMMQWADSIEALAVALDETRNLAGGSKGAESTG